MIDKKAILDIAVEAFNTSIVAVVKKRQRKFTECRSAAISIMYSEGLRYSDIKEVFGYTSNNSITNALRGHRKYLKSKEQYKIKYICIVHKLKGNGNINKESKGR